MREGLRRLQQGDQLARLLSHLPAEHRVPIASFLLTSSTHAIALRAYPIGSGHALSIWDTCRCKSRVQVPVLPLKSKILDCKSIQIFRSPVVRVLTFTCWEVMVLA